LLGPLVLIAAIVALTYAVRGASHRLVAAPTGHVRPVERPVDVRPEATRPELASDLARWVADGLVSDDQAAAILVREQTRAAATVGAPAPVVPARRGIPVVAEALGYLGVMLGVVGLVLIVARYWPDMATPWRVALSATGGLALLWAGALIPEQTDPALARLRWFLWLGSAAATALCAAVLTADGFGTDSQEAVTAAAAGSAALHSGLLWSWHKRPLQQLTALGGLAVFAGALVAGLTGGGPAGLTVWVIGVAYVVVGLRRGTPLPTLTLATGAVTAVVGAAVLTGDWQAVGLAFSVVNALALLAVAAIPGLVSNLTDQRTIALVGGLALWQTAPAAIGYFAEDAGVATGVTTWLCGALLIAVGARRLVRLPEVVEALGGAVMLGGAALTGLQWDAAAPVFGVVTAVALVALGMAPGRVHLSVLGSLGLLVNLPWAIARLFPGEGRVPLLILVSGAVLIAMAVLLTRSGGRLRRRRGAPPARS
jgi:hypothetical protein